MGRCFPHLVTLENGDEDHQPRSGSAPAARAVLLPQIAQHSEHGHQLCSPCAVCVACAGCGARAVRCARCWLTCKCRSIAPTRLERRALQSRLSCDAMSRLPAASSSAAQPADSVYQPFLSPLQYDCPNCSSHMPTQGAKLSFTPPERANALQHSQSLPLDSNESI